MSNEDQGVAALPAADAAFDGRVGDESFPWEPQYGDLMVFTACRVWRFAEESRHCSKSEAAEWALARDASLSAVEAAVRRRHGDPTPLDEEPVRRLLATVREFLT